MFSSVACRTVRRCALGCAKRGNSGEPKKPQELEEERFTREEVREIIRKTWEEKIQMGEEELAKVQANDAPIFQAHPLTGYHPTSCGPMPVPFQFTNSAAVVIGGFANYDAMRDLVASDDLHLVKCADGSTPVLMIMWQHNDTTTTVGENSNSLQMMAFVSREETETVPAHPLIHNALMNDVLHPSVRCLPIGMWEESEQALAFNREVLGFPSLPALAYYDNHVSLMKDLYNEHKRVRGYSFVDTLTGHTIMKGESFFWEGGLRSPTTYARLLALLGPKQFLQRSLQKYQRIPLISPKSSYIPHHCDSSLVFQSNLEQMRIWGRCKPWLYKDTMMFGKTRFVKLQFTPTYVNHMGGCDGVITAPVNHNGDVVTERIGWESEEPTFPHLPLASMSISSRHGRLPAGSPLHHKGVAHLPPPEVVMRNKEILTKIRRGEDVPSSQLPNKEEDRRALS